MVNKENILTTYFDGVTQKLQAEIDYIHKLIGHAGETGRANEQLLIDLLRKFLPKRFSIGCGIIIDKDGNRSKQIDVIVYDSYFHPEIFAQGTTILFPVDIVYLVIEIKTLMKKDTVAQAIDNIASVKKLNFIKGKTAFMRHEPPNTESVASFVLQDLSPPIGVIFGYRSDTRDENTFATWFESIKTLNNKEKFDMCYTLETTFFFISPSISPNPKNPNEFTQAIFNLIQDRNNIESNKNDEYTNPKNNRKYPIIDVGEHHHVVDPARGLLNFLSVLNDILKEKQIIQTGIIREYLPNELSNIFAFD